MFFVVFISVFLSTIYVLVIYYRKVAECMELARKNDQLEILKESMLIPYHASDGEISDFNLVTLAIWGSYKKKGLCEELTNLLDETKKVFILQFLFSVVLVFVPIFNKYISGG